MLKVGSRGQEVAAWQRFLNRRGARLAVDGVFGQSTKAAVIQWQQQNTLAPDGIIGPASQQKYHEQLNAGSASLVPASQLLGVDVASIYAIKKVESNGTGFLGQGIPKILFERHIFNRELSKARGTVFAAHIRATHPEICNTKTGGYKGGHAEHGRLEAAKRIDLDCALKSASWGAFQIMGFNYAACGYLTVNEFVADMHEGEDKHLLALCQFIKANKAMHAALKAKDWATFAKLYNGPAYAKNHYDTKLAAAYKEYAS